MGKETEIAWCDSTFNPWIGCTKVSPGCANCYAENSTLVRVKRQRGVELWGGKNRHRTSKSYWRAPIMWNKLAPAVKGRIKVFPSLCDWLDIEPPIEWLADFLNLIGATPNLDWLLLTKRPSLFKDQLGRAYSAPGMGSGKPETDWIWHWANGYGCVPKNVWLGTSVEDQKRADERIPVLLDIPARIRFLSVEPLLGPVNLGLTQYQGPREPGNERHIHWVIVGGESGPKARPCNAEWIRSIVEQCREAMVPCFVKQLGSNVDPGCGFGPFFAGTRAVLKHDKGGDPEEWPSELRVREFPV